MLSLAQAPSSFEINIVSESEYAVAGQPFTYTIVITNISQIPVEDVIVFMETPTGTTFAGTGQKVDWFTSGLDAGQTGTVGWVTMAPIMPNEVATFELGLNILPEMANKQLINSEYGIVPLGEGDIIAFGPPVQTQVLLTVPTATPVPPPTASATATNTIVPTATPSLTVSTTSTSTSQSRSAIPSSITPTPVMPLSTDTTSEAMAWLSISTLMVIGISILIISGVGLIWFLKHR